MHVTINEDTRFVPFTVEINIGSKSALDDLEICLQQWSSSSQSFKSVNAVTDIRNAIRRAGR